MSEKGTGQGQTISPFLANIHLHNVLDEWFEEVVKSDSGVKPMRFDLPMMPF